MPKNWYADDCRRAELSRTPDPTSTYPSLVRLDLLTLQLLHRAQANPSAIALYNNRVNPLIHPAE